MDIVFSLVSNKIFLFLSYPSHLLSFPCLTFLPKPRLSLVHLTLLVWSVLNLSLVLPCVQVVMFPCLLAAPFLPHSPLSASFPLVFPHTAPLTHWLWCWWISCYLHWHCLRLHHTLPPPPTNTDHKHVARLWWWYWESQHAFPTFNCLLKWTHEHKTWGNYSQTLLACFFTSYSLSTSYHFIYVSLSIISITRVSENIIPCTLFLYISE